MADKLPVNVTHYGYGHSAGENKKINHEGAGLTPPVTGLCVRMADDKTAPAEDYARRRRIAT
jgi:hypothetical protein